MAWSRRQRLIARTVVLGVAAAIVVVVLLLLRPEPKPYIPGEQIDGLTESLSRDLPTDHPQVKFVDVSAAAGIDFVHFSGTRSKQLPEDMGSGAAWGDYDRDGYLDLYVVNVAGPLTMTPEQLSASPARNALYHNDGDGTFTELALQAGVDGADWGQAAAWGDYDGDGWLDLCVTNFGQIRLYRNRGDGSFEEVSAESGVAGIVGFWAGASWADYDVDGDLDLYVCGYVRYRHDPGLISQQKQQYNTLIPASLNPSSFEPERNLLFRNEGDGTFSEVAAMAGVDNAKGRSLSASWSDFDGDGWPDLYVANDLSDNVMFHSNGDGTFVDRSHAAWVADYRGAMGLAVGDWDGDGDQDIYVTHWIAQENALYSNMGGDFRSAGLKNEESALRFVDVAEQFGLGQVALDFIGWGTAFLDYDNDGRPDLLVVNGSTFQQEEDSTRLIPMENQLFWNRGTNDGYFEVGAVSGAAFSQARVGRGLAVGDYDNDGDVDAFVVCHGDRAQLLRNDGGSGNNWLKVRLQGAGGNRHGQGARLRLVAGDRAQSREVGASSSYYSQHAVGEEVFGLGGADSADTLTVTWPGGKTEHLTALTAGQTVVVRQDAAGGRADR